MDVEKRMAAAPTPPWRDSNGELIPIRIPALAERGLGLAAAEDPAADTTSAGSWPSWPVS